uniref:Uncharacterized protein MANES_14G151400 n=1 Tax=Rhizophora mucronata TaxID=61149 RepID=A0A2P2L0N2_RHIMU
MDPSHLLDPVLNNNENSNKLPLPSQHQPLYLPESKTQTGQGSKTQTRQGSKTKRLPSFLLPKESHSHFVSLGNNGG